MLHFKYLISAFQGDAVKSIMKKQNNTQPSV